MSVEKIQKPTMFSTEFRPRSTFWSWRTVTNAYRLVRLGYFCFCTLLVFYKTPFLRSSSSLPVRNFCPLHWANRTITFSVFFVTVVCILCQPNASVQGFPRRSRVTLTTPAVFHLRDCIQYVIVRSFSPARTNVIWAYTLS